jgi:hypothetical protein
MKGEDQSHEPEVMIAMQVTDEDMVDAMHARVKFHQLDLRGFTAVDQEMAVLNFNELRGGMATIGGQRSTGSKDGNTKRQSPLL